MIVQEVFDWEGRSLTKTYSNDGFLVRQIETGDLYGEAVDPTDMHREYEETDIPIEQDEIEDSEALRIITGGDANETE